MNARSIGPRYRFRFPTRSSIESESVNRPVHPTEDTDTVSSREGSNRDDDSGS